MNDARNVENISTHLSTILHTRHQMESQRLFILAFPLYLLCVIYMLFWSFGFQNERTFETGVVCFWTLLINGTLCYLLLFSGHIVEPLFHLIVLICFADVLHASLTLWLYLYREVGFRAWRNQSGLYFIPHVILIVFSSLANVSLSVFITCRYLYNSNNKLQQQNNRPAFIPVERQLVDVIAIVVSSVSLGIFLQNTDKFFGLFCSFLIPTIVSFCTLVRSRGKSKTDFPYSLRYQSLFLMLIISVVFSGPLNFYPLIRLGNNDADEGFLQMYVGFSLLKGILSPSAMILSDGNLLRAVLQQPCEEAIQEYRNTCNISSDDGKFGQNLAAPPQSLLLAAPTILDESDFLLDIEDFEKEDCKPQTSKSVERVLIQTNDTGEE